MRRLHRSLPRRLGTGSEALDDVVDADGEGLDIGGVDYVTKPFNPLELAPLVRDLLERIERGERDELRGEKLAELRSLMEMD